MQDSLGAKSLWTPMEGGGAMEEGLSPGKTTQKWIVLERMRLAGLPSPWWKLACVSESLSRWVIMKRLKVVPTSITNLILCVNRSPLSLIRPTDLLCHQCESSAVHLCIWLRDVRQGRRRAAADRAEELWPEAWDYCQVCAVFHTVIDHLFQSRRNCHFTLSAFFFLHRELGLKRPIYQATASYGHFGREEFPWEKPKPLVFWMRSLTPFEKKNNHRIHLIDIMI